MAMRRGRGRGRFAWPARLSHNSQNTQPMAPPECSPQPQNAPHGSGGGQGHLPVLEQEQNVNRSSQVELDSQGAQGSTSPQGDPHPQAGHSGTTISGSESQDFPSSSGTRASGCGISQNNKASLLELRHVFFTFHNLIYCILTFIL